MTKSFICTLCTLFLLFGILFGFLLAPIKNGIHIIHNSNHPAVPMDDIDL